MQDVSVIMPAKNAAATIARAAASVLAEPEVLELIVVDDDSSDDTRKVVEALGDPRIVVVEGGGNGVTLALNIGIAVARGKYFARCDADDAWTNSRLSWQRPFMESHSDHVAISGAFAAVTTKAMHVTDLATEGPPRDVTESLLNGRTVTHLCTFLARMDAVRDMGAARPWFRSGQDLDMQFRLAEHGRVHHVPEVCLLYTLHENSITHRLGQYRREHYEGSAARFAEQRRATGTDDLEQGNPPALPPEESAGMPSSAAAQIAGMLTGEAWRRFEAGERYDPLRRAALAIRFAPQDAVYWKSFFSMFFRTLRLK